jgi:rSAM/selenodomain-associated transferase 2
MRISIIIPTLNEAENISKSIAFLHQHGRTLLAEIIVVDASSTDNTLSLAQAQECTVISVPKASRAFQMNEGAKIAKGDILYFVHADVKPPESYAQDILDAIQAGYDFGCFRHRFDSKKWPLVLNSWIYRKLNFNVFGGDQTLFITKNAFESLNGFDEQFIIMEEFDFVDRAKKKFRHTMIKKDVWTSDRKYDNNSYLKVNYYNVMAFRMYKQGKSPESIKAFYSHLYSYNKKN